MSIVAKYYTFQYRISKQNIFALLGPGQNGIAYSLGTNSTATNIYHYNKYSTKQH